VIEGARQEPLRGVLGHALGEPAVRDGAQGEQPGAGLDVLENKFSLALLLEKYSAPGLANYAVLGWQEVREWCAARLVAPTAQGGKVWMVKDSGANCGQGLFVMSRDNWEQVVAKVAALEKASQRRRGWVIQEYVSHPDLWQGTHKYHLRIYVVFCGDCSVYLHNHALGHIANKPYHLDKDSFTDEEVHLTNVSRNHHNVQLFHPCPAIDLKAFLGTDRWERLVALLQSVFKLAMPFCLHQAAKEDFSLIGADIMVDRDGQPHLLECNIPPCLGRADDNASIQMEETQLIRNLFHAIVQRFCLLQDTSVDRWWTEICPGNKDFKPCSWPLRGLNTLAWKLVEKNMLDVRERTRKAGAAG
jgi:hypothetical protein